MFYYRNPDIDIRELERRWKEGDLEVGRAYARALQRIGYLDELWERTLEHDHEAAQEARQLRKLLELPEQLQNRNCYIAMAHCDEEDCPFIDPITEESLFWVYLDGKRINTTALYQSDVDIQISYHIREAARDPRWERVIDSEHYHCPNCYPI